LISGPASQIFTADATNIKSITFDQLTDGMVHTATGKW
jgi:hypothetical protein